MKVEWISILLMRHLVLTTARDDPDLLDSHLRFFFLDTIVSGHVSRVLCWSISAYFAPRRHYYFAQSLLDYLRVEILDELLVFVIHHLHIETHMHLA